MACCVFVCVCFSSEWGFAAPDTVISSSRMYFLSRWRCGGSWGVGGGDPTTDNTSLSNVLSHDSACHSTTTCTISHARTHTHTKNTHTDSRPFLIDRWLSQQIESSDRHPRGPSPPYTHSCGGITCVWVCVCVLCVCERDRTFHSNKGGIRDALVGCAARGLSITAARINPETSIRRQRPSQIAAS